MTGGGGRETCYGLLSSRWKICPAEVFLVLAVTAEPSILALSRSALRVCHAAFPSKIQKNIMSIGANKIMDK